MSWQDIDTAPKDGRLVIVLTAQRVGEAYFDAFDGWIWAGFHPADDADLELRPLNPTHWLAPDDV